MADGKLVGIDLNIDHDFISDVVRQVALATIAEAMDEKNHIVEAIVRQVLRQQVNENGEPPRYSSDARYTLLEYYVRKMLTDVVKSEVVALVEEKRGEITTLVRGELEKQSTVDSFVNAFMGSLTDSLSSSYWRPEITMSFERRTDIGF